MTHLCRYFDVEHGESFLQLVAAQIAIVIRVELTPDLAHVAPDANPTVSDLALYEV